MLGQTRGAVEWADKFEWGGYNQKGVWEFDSERPGWTKPIHQLMVDNGVTILFQGHDHLFAKEELDGIVYQECPMPSDATYNVGSENEDAYPSAIIYKNSGHLRVTVSDVSVIVDYIRAYLPQDETADHPNGEVAYSYTIKAANTAVPAKKTLNSLPKKFKLNQNYPNPFNSETAISFSVFTADKISLNVYNIIGKNIATLLDEYLSAGTYHYQWQANNLPSGVYFYTLNSGLYSETKKMIFLQ